MKIKHQILALGFVGMIAAGFVGGIGLYQASMSEKALQKMQDMATAMQRSLLADMMHDAIRGDVLLLLQGASTQNADQISEAHHGLSEHAKTFKNTLQALEESTLPDEVRSALRSTKPLVNAYIASAMQAQEMAAKDLATAGDHVDVFQASFESLEAQMAQLSESIATTVARDQDLLHADVRRAKIMVLLALLCAVALAMVGALWLARRLSQPVTQAADIANALADGNFNTAITPQGSYETVRMLRALDKMQNSFVRTVLAVKESSERVANASAEIAMGNGDLASRTEEQASALEQTAASMQELGTRVRQNAESADQANQLAASASQAAAEGGAVVAEVVATMQGINESSRKIGDIISVIDGIAFQTNILALNAAVEAARAGEQGRGFAVVASEVRSLAGRSAEAAKEISSLIHASVERVELGTALVDKAGETMAGVVGHIRSVTDIMGEITAASGEQSNAVSQVSEAMAHMDQATQQNATLVEEMAAAANSLKGQADELVDVVAVFQL